jgi:putative DNA primase/helicase
MSTAEYPVWLAVLPDQRDAARADAGKHPDGRNAIAWSKEAQLWYARPGADLSRLKAWMPDRSIRSSGGGDPQSEFLDALTSAGLVLDGLPLMDGERHRVSVVDGSKGNRDGVYRGFLDGIKPGGWFINYHTAENDKDITRWKASGRPGEADPVARVHIRAVMRQSQDDAARAQAALYARQTASAGALYHRLPAADPEHGYLTRKGVTVSPDIRQTRNGALVLPFYNADGEFRTLQYIPPDGEKYLFKDAPKSGHFRVEGEALRNGEPILYAEGYATARSLHMVTGRPVVMTIDAGNMQAVAGVLKARYPDSPHLFMADVDHAKENNKGVLSAERAAAATGGAVLLPDLTAADIERGFTDFNDLHHSRGAERLRETLLPDIAQALERLNYKEAPMAIPDDAQPAPENTPSRRPGAAKEKTAEILSLRDQGLKPAQIAEQLGIGQTSVYRILKAQPADAPVTESVAPAVAVSEPVSPAVTAAPAQEPAPEQPATAQAPVSVAATPSVSPAPQSGIPSAPAAPVTPPPVAGPYDGFTGLYGTGAELRDRLAALASGQTSPAALLQDISTLRARVDSVAIADVYAGGHMKEMQQVFDRVTQGGMAGADVMETGALSRLRGLLGQRDTWSSLHPSSPALDVNTVPDRIAQQYVMLAGGEVTRAQFDREVKMLYGEFTRAEPASFTAGRQSETREVFERMAALESPDRAARYAAGVTASVAQLPPASAEDPNVSALYRIQNALRDEFVSLARGEATVPALTANVARLHAQLDEAKTHGVYSASHVDQIQGAFDRLTKGGLAGMPSADAPAPRGDYASRHPASATLDVASVPERVEAQYNLLVRGEVTRSQFEDNLAVLRNEVAKQSATGRANPESVAAATGVFATLSTLSAPAAATSPAPAITPDATPQQPVPATVSSSGVAPSASVTATDVPATPAVLATAAPEPAPVATASTGTVRESAPAETAAQPATAEVSVPVSGNETARAPAEDFEAAFSDISDRMRELKDEAASLDTETLAYRTGGLINERIGLTEMWSQGNNTENPRWPSEESEALEAELRAVLDKRPDTSSSPLASAFGEENAILVGAPRVAPSEEDAPASSGSKSSRIDADRLLSRVTHDMQPDGKSVLYKLDGEPAFYDRGNRLVMAEGASAQQEKVLAALLTASQQYHGRIELTGSDEFKAFAIGVIVANKLDVSMKNAGQQADLDAARRTAGQPVAPVAPIDAVRGEQNAPQPVTAPPVTPAAAQQVPAEAPAHTGAHVTASPQPVAAPAPQQQGPKIAPDIHTPAEKAREPVTGKVTACGQAPFRFETNAPESTFITLRTKEGPQTFWGKELAGLLRETNLQPGRMATLQWMGEQPVKIKVPHKNEDGVVTHYKDVDAHRNQWSLAPVGGARVQTGGNEMVPLSAFDVNRYIQIQHAVVSRLGLDMPAPPKPADGLYWLKPDGQGSSVPGDALSAPRPAHNETAGVAVMSAWAANGNPDLYLVQGDGNYLQGVVRQNGEYQHVLVSLPDSKEAPPMVVNVLTPEGAVPVGSGNGINRSNGQPVPREHVVVRLTGDAEPRIAKLDAPAEVPAALHARLGYDERYKAESGWVKEPPAAAPQAAPVTPPRPAQ